MEIVKFFFENWLNYLLLLLLIHVVVNKRALNDMVKTLLKPFGIILLTSFEFFKKNKNKSRGKNG